jgi:hypothetical protein
LETAMRAFFSRQFATCLLPNQDVERISQISNTTGVL